jgi:16S rRNA C1402 (ribose-2'-O) methylase RsmI
LPWKERRSGDAGTPLVSDPGPVVRAAVSAGIQVVPVPGPTAAIAALVASGLPPDRFVFEGSLPRKRGHREELFARLHREPSTTIAYESPHRLQETLDLLARELPDRDVVVAREVYKLHEEFVRGRATELALLFAARGEVRGECVLSSAGKRRRRTLWIPSDRTPCSRSPVRGLSDREKLLVAALGMPKNRAYESPSSASTLLGVCQRRRSLRRRELDANAHPVPMIIPTTSSIISFVRPFSPMST